MKSFHKKIPASVCSLLVLATHDHSRIRKNEALAKLVVTSGADEHVFFIIAHALRGDNQLRRSFWQRPEIVAAKKSLIDKGLVKESAYLGDASLERLAAHCEKIFLVSKTFSLEELLWMYMRYGLMHQLVSQWIMSEISDRLPNLAFFTVHHAYMFITHEGWEHDTDGHIDVDASRNKGIRLMEPEPTQIHRGLNRQLIDCMIQKAAAPDELIAIHRVAPTRLNVAERLYELMTARKKGKFRD